MSCIFLQSLVFSSTHLYYPLIFCVVLYSFVTKKSCIWKTLTLFPKHTKLSKPAQKSISKFFNFSNTLFNQKSSVNKVSWNFLKYLGISWNG